MAIDRGTPGRPAEQYLIESRTRAVKPGLVLLILFCKSPRSGCALQADDNAIAIVSLRCFVL